MKKLRKLSQVKLSGIYIQYTHSFAGAAEACGGATGRQQLHDPPLIFDLQRDESEETTLEVDTPEYQAVLRRITRRREELLWDIATDKSVSLVDYSTDESAVPCCDPRRAVCRCDTVPRCRQADTESTVSF